MRIKLVCLLVFTLASCLNITNNTKVHSDDISKFEKALSGFDIEDTPDVVNAPIKQSEKMIAPLNLVNNDGEPKTTDMEPVKSDENSHEASIEKFESNMDNINKNLLGLQDGVSDTSSFLHNKANDDESEIKSIEDDVQNLDLAIKNVKNKNMGQKINGADGDNRPTVNLSRQDFKFDKPVLMPISDDDSVFDDNSENWDFDGNMIDNPIQDNDSFLDDLDKKYSQSANKEALEKIDLVDDINSDTSGNFLFDELEDDFSDDIDQLDGMEDSYLDNADVSESDFDTEDFLSIKNKT